MASEAAAADVESPAAADAEATAAAAAVEEPTAPQHSAESEGESLNDEVPAEAESGSSEKEEIAQDAVDNVEPESGEVDDSDQSTKITEGKSSNDEVTTEAEGESIEKEEGAQDVDNIEPESNEVDDSDKTLKITVDDIKTAPIDFRFPTTNQAKHCFTRYNEYHKCVKETEGSPDCEKYARWYRSLCPGEWIERWNEQRENGTFPGRY